MNKKHLFFSGLFICSGILLSFYNDSSFKTTIYHKSPLNAAGAPAGKTGAPGENNCTGCHAGSALDGTSENILTVTHIGTGNVASGSYIPGDSYQVSLEMLQAHAKKGFQVTAFDASNQMAGNFLSGSNTNIKTSGSKKYAGHTASSNTHTTSVWDWEWTAPTGNSNVTFYVATNAANNNNTSSGDNIYLSQHVLSSEADVSELIISDLNIAYNATANSIKVNFASLKRGSASINITAMNGKSVFYSNLGLSEMGQNNIEVPLFKKIKQGIYIVNIFIDNAPSSKKIFIN